MLICTTIYVLCDICICTTAAVTACLALRQRPLRQAKPYFDGIARRRALLGYITYTTCQYISRLRLIQVVHMSRRHGRSFTSNVWRALYNTSCGLISKIRVMMMMMMMMLMLMLMMMMDDDVDDANDYADGSQYGYRLSCREDPPRPHCEPSVANLIGTLNQTPTKPEQCSVNLLPKIGWRLYREHADGLEVEQVLPGRLDDLRWGQGEYNSTRLRPFSMEPIANINSEMISYTPPQ